MPGNDLKYSIGDLVLVKGISLKTYMNRSFRTTSGFEPWAESCVGQVCTIISKVDFGRDQYSYYVVGFGQGNQADILESEVEILYTSV